MFREAPVENHWDRLHVNSDANERQASKIAKMSPVLAHNFVILYYSADAV